MSCICLYFAGLDNNDLTHLAPNPGEVLVPLSYPTVDMANLYDDVLFPPASGHDKPVIKTSLPFFASINNEGNLEQVTDRLNVSTANLEIRSASMVSAANTVSKIIDLKSEMIRSPI